LAISLFDHPHFKTLFGRDDLAAYFSPEAELSAMLRFEAALAEAEAHSGLIPSTAAASIVRAIEQFSPDPALLQAGIARDGIVVPALISALRETLDPDHRSYLHVGATSQDVIDTGLILRLKPALALLRTDIERVVVWCERQISDLGGTPQMGRTRMQRALPIRLADRVGTWKRPFERHLASLDGLQDDLLVVQLGGPVGTLDKLGDRGAAVRADLARRLGLNDPGSSWHSERARIADLANWLSNVSGSLGKMGQDIAILAQNEVGEVVIEAGGLSSAMPHKRNPVHAELLVTLARFSASQLAAMHQALVHEGERSGSAWTLEWLIIPPMVAATGAGLSLALTMMDGLIIGPGVSPNKG
jgi:3-carboxy-cis,cis-muconate cycloisomerase